MNLVNCPNCKREFFANGAKGEYCPECWRAFSRNDGSFERREKEWPETSAARARASINVKERPMHSDKLEQEIARVVQSVNEWDDRTSPDEYPEHLLITSEELADILRQFSATVLAVAPLDWASPPGFSGTWFAKSIFGEYSVWHAHFRRPHETGGIRAGSSVEDAKAAAQADYEDRIRSALFSKGCGE